MTGDFFQEGAILSIDKPYTWTSTDLVRKVKYLIEKKFNIKLKVGHAGTLDPLATGLVIICTGKFTKRIEEMQSGEKVYSATLKFGETTPSFDLEKTTDFNFPYEHITLNLIENAIKPLIGKVLQKPPSFSAKRVDGKRAYDLARGGNMVEIDASPIVIKEIAINEYVKPYLRINVTCGKGTYIRSLVRDLGVSLNSGANLVALKRTRIGEYTIEDSLNIFNFENSLNKI
jgi:tRNA pseudouridine55 synthase